jgi:putative phosphoribosyl transferase
MRPRTAARMHEVALTAGGVELGGFLTVPEEAQAIVLFVHGSGSSRFSERNQYVAEVLNDAGLVTLLFDLLTQAENETDVRTREWRFNIPLLAQRTVGAVQWVQNQQPLKAMPIGLFGASTGAAAALIAAAEQPRDVSAVVSRGGRPDLAGEALHRVEAPTLLIVGGYDLPVIEMNREAARALSCEHRIEIVPGASHLFEEPGTLEYAAQLAQKWFTSTLTESNPTR